MAKDEHTDPAALKPGDPHYKAYVGPPRQYDFMGATQFSLLVALGLRSRHRVLDFGCGSLRAGRLLLAYLDPERYFAVEPNRWLIDEAIEKEIGNDLIRIKRPSFDYNDRFRADCFEVEFDFILAHSIFSHAGPETIERALPSFRHALRPDGIVAATFKEGDEEAAAGPWVYPGSVPYRPATIAQFAERAGLASIRIPWFHPRQTWYLLAAERDRLPAESTVQTLRGPALNPESQPLG
jgi:SAM-dependent methyltransferase